MGLEIEINLYCKECKQDITRTLDTTDPLECADCGYEKTMRVDMSVLREKYDTARKGRILVE